MRAKEGRQDHVNHAMSPADYKDLVLFLATAGIVAPLFKRLKLNPILGFLIAGVILGPFGLGALSHTSPGWTTSPSTTPTKSPSWPSSGWCSCCS
jgi:hypothetical protein